MALRSPLQILCRVMASTPLPMALRVVVTVRDDSSWQLDQGYMGKVGKETCDTLWVSAGLLVDILMLDIVGVVVILAVEVVVEVLMF
jgi:hypothetical protein